MGKNLKRVSAVIITLIALLLILFPMTTHAIDKKAMTLDVNVLDFHDTSYGDADSLKTPVEFVVRDSKGEIIGNYTTDEHGHVVIDGIGNDTQYYLDLSDRSIDCGYMFDFETDVIGKWNGTLYKDQYNNSLGTKTPGIPFLYQKGNSVSRGFMPKASDFVNIKQSPMKITIQKLQSGNETIDVPNAKFSLYKYNGKAVTNDGDFIFNIDSQFVLKDNTIFCDNKELPCTLISTDLVTGPTGEIETEMSTGIYLLFETEVPEGYIGAQTDDGYLLGKSVIVTRYSETPQKVVITNEVSSSITVHKTGLAKEDMADVKFTLNKTYYNGSELKRTVVKENCSPDENGILVFSDLPYGEYEIIETPKEGWYQTVPTNVSVNGSKTNYDVTINNKPIELRGFKINSENNEPVPDVAFTLYKVEMDTDGKITNKVPYDNGKEGKFVSNIDGQFMNLREVPAGWYVLTETPNPKTVIDTKRTTISNYSGTMRIENNDIIFYVSDDCYQSNMEIQVYNTVLPRFDITLNKHGPVINGVRSYTDSLTGKEVFVFTDEDILIKGAEFTLYANEDIVDGENIIYHAGDVVSTVVTDGINKMQFNNLYPGSYKLSETKVPAGYKQAADEILNVCNNIDNKDIYNILHRVNIAISKTDAESKEPIVNAIFGIFAQNDIVVDDEVLVKKDDCVGLMTTLDGGYSAQSFELPIGQYYVKEVQAPNGYVLSPETKQFTYHGVYEAMNTENVVKGEGFFSFDANDTSITQGKDAEQEPNISFKFTNNKSSGTIEVHKTGDAIDETEIANGKIVWKTDAPLAGTQFTLIADGDVAMPDGKIIYKDGQIIKTAETNAEGKVVFTNLVPGNYKVKETKALNGYHCDEKTQLVTITGNGDIKTLNFVNTRYLTNVIVQKTDIDGVGLKGAIFGIYNLEDIQNANGDILIPADTCFKEFTSDETGLAKVEDLKLPVGDYRIKEIKAPEGYKKTDSVFALSATGTPDDEHAYVYSFKVVNLVDATDTTNSVVINKVDATDNSPIIGAEMTLYNGDAIVTSWVTDGTPKELTKLPEGTYTVKETKTPFGYKTADDLEFTLEGTDNKAEYTITDERLLGTITVVKFEKGTTNPLAGVKFALKDADGKVLNNATTNADGKAVFSELPVAIYENGKATSPIKYIIEELATLDGYINEQNEITVFFDDDSTTNDDKSNKEVIVYNDFTKINIVKVDSDTELPINGAHFVLKDSNGKTIKEWTEDNLSKFYIEKLAPGKYTLVETKAPDGYIMPENNEVEFTVKATGDVQTITIKNTRNKHGVSIVKKDIDGNIIAGALLELHDSDGKVVDSWTSTTEPHIITNLQPGIYTLVEKEAPAGYIKADKPITIEVKADSETKDLNFEIVNDYTKVEFSKVETGTDKFVIGAKLHLEDKDGNKVAEWVVSDKPYRINHLSSGEYTLVEDEAPAGYTKAEPMKIVVKNTKDIQKFVMEDDFTKIEISKVEKGTNKFVKGAKLHIEDKNGKTILSWVSSDKAYVIDHLSIGEYTLVEDEAPAGYIKSNPVKFVVTDSNKPVKVVMEDDFTKVEISKVEKGTNKFIEGAKLHIEDKDGKTILSWVSSDKAYVVDHLSIGEYKLVEDEAPAGYIKSNPVKFVVTDSGKSVKVVMEDDYTKVEVSKVEKCSHTTVVVGASMHIEDANGKQVASWVTTDKPYVITHLPAGTYTLVEDAAPEKYIKSDAVVFEVTETGEIQKLVMEDDYTKVSINKYVEGTKNYLKGASMQIKDKDGNIVDEWVTTDSAHDISHLLTGKYTLVEVAAPEGYKTAEPIEFVVTASGDVLVVNMYDEVANSDGNPEGPKTGDISKSLIYIGLMSISVLGLACCTIHKKKYFN